MSRKHHPLIPFIIAAIVIALLFLSSAILIPDPLFKGVLVGLSASILAYFIIAVLESVHGINLLSFDLIQRKLSEADDVIRQKLSHADELVSQGLVRSFSERKDINWEALQMKVKKRYWACGTSLRPLAGHEEIFQGMIKKDVEIKIILPSTSDPDNSFRQLREIDEYRPDDQIVLAQRAWNKINSILSSHKKAELRQYKGIMYENITILDDVAIISFYNTTGSGNSSWTLQFEGSGSKGFKYVEREFQRMWGACEPVAVPAKAHGG